MTENNVPQSPALGAAEAAAEAASPLAAARQSLAVLNTLTTQATTAIEEGKLFPWEEGRVRSRQDGLMQIVQTNALVSIAESLHQLVENTRRPGGGNF